MIYSSFFAKTSDTYKYIKDKRPQLHFDYDEIMHETHNRVFTIAKMTNIDLLNDVKNSLENAYKNGVNFEDWKKQIKPTLKKKGWLGKTKVVNPKTGEEKEIYVGSRRLKTIYNTNMRTNYAKSRYESQMQSSIELFRYTAVMDNLTRPLHRSMHNLVLPKTDPFWDTNYPPNGWNCRCKVQALTKSEANRKGLKVRDSGVINIADKDFAYNPGKIDKIDEILANKKDRFKLNTNLTSKEVNVILRDLENFTKQRDMYVYKKSLDNAIDELLVKKDLKSPINAFALGKLSKDIIKKSEDVLNKKIETPHIMGDKKGILHIRSEIKGEYGQDLKIEELREIVKVLNDDKTPVSVDLKKKNIIFWFDDKEDKTKINKIVVDLNYKLKKFGLTNYMVTVGKINKDDITKKYKRIR